MAGVENLEFYYYRFALNYCIYSTYIAYWLN